jgi:hypothetical protein
MVICVFLNNWLWLFFLCSWGEGNGWLALVSSLSLVGMAFASGDAGE